MDMLDVLLRIIAIVALAGLIAFSGVMTYVVILAILDERRRKKPR